MPAVACSHERLHRLEVLRALPPHVVLCCSTCITVESRTLKERRNPDLDGLHSMSPARRYGSDSGSFGHFHLELHCHG